MKPADSRFLTGLALLVLAAPVLSAQNRPATDWHVAFDSIKVGDKLRVSALPDRRARKVVLQTFMGDTLLLGAGTRSSMIWGPDITRIDVGEWRVPSGGHVLGSAAKGLVIGGLIGGAAGMLVGSTHRGDEDGPGAELDNRGFAMVFLGGAGIVAGGVGGLAVGLYKGNQSYVSWHTVLRR